jgi:hypothetical protein
MPARGVDGYRGAIGARVAVPTLLEPDAAAPLGRAVPLTSPCLPAGTSRAWRRFRGRSSYAPGLMFWCESCTPWWPRIVRLERHRYVNPRWPTPWHLSARLRSVRSARAGRDGVADAHGARDDGAQGHGAHHLGCFSEPLRGSLDQHAPGDARGRGRSPRQPAIA